MSSKSVEREKTKEGFRLGLLGAIFLIALAGMIMTIIMKEHIVDLKCDLDDLNIPECSCPDAFAWSWFIGIGGYNQSTIIDTESDQQIHLLRPIGYTSGGSVYVSKQGEIWDINANPGAGGTNIGIFETTTNVKRTEISLPIQCVGSDYDIAYHPLAGQEKRGQVWVSCDAGDIWAVYDPASRTLLKTIELPQLYKDLDYELFEIVVGEDFAVASLLNTTSAGSGVLIQFATTAEIVANRSVGPIPHLWYQGACDSKLYVASEFDGTLLALDFDTLVTEQTSVGLDSPVFVTTDPSERFVYVLNGTSSTGSDSIKGFLTRDITIELPSSPYSTPYGYPQQLSINAKSNKALVVYDSETDISMFGIYTSDGDLTAGSMDYEATSSGSTVSVTLFENICPCDLCVFYSQKTSNQKILEALAPTA